MRLLLIFSVTLGLAACCIQMPPARPDPIVDDDGGNLGPPLWPEGAITFGTTDDNGEVFQAIGGKLELHRGPQGGNHAYAKYQVTGQTAASAVFEYRVRRVRDGLLVSKGNRTFDVAPADGGVWTSEGSVTMFLCPTAPGVSIVNEALSFQVTAKGSNGKLLGQASVTSTLECMGCEADCGG